MLAKWLDLVILCHLNPLAETETPDPLGGLPGVQRTPQLLDRDKQSELHSSNHSVQSTGVSHQNEFTFMFFTAHL